MKKFISAASSMAMVASLVGSAIPFTSIAAESTKTLELRAFNDKDNKAVSTTISAEAIAAGDVTIPVGIYYVEKTNDTKSVRASFGITAKNGGDASKVSFGVGDEHKAYNPGDDYFNSDIDVTVGGKTYQSKDIISFTGTMAESRNGVVFKPSGTFTTSLDTKQDSQKWSTAWGSLVWAQPVQGGYEWSGETSDAFPGYVFDCTFPKGTPAGTYTIEFVNMVPDEKYPNVWSTMVESSEGGLVYTADAGNLICKGLTITIGGDGGEDPTEVPATTAKPTTNKPTTAPTTAKPDDDDSGDFTVVGSTVNYDPSGKNYMDFTTKSNGHKGAMIVFEIGDLPKGVTAEVDPVSMTFANQPQWSVMGETWSLQCFDPTSGDTQLFNDDEYVVSFLITADDTVKDGTYEIGFDRFHVVEQPNELVGPIVEFDAKVVPGKLVIGNDTPEDKPTTAPTTKPTEDVSDADFIVKGSEVTYDASAKNYMDFTTESKGHKGAMIVFEIGDLPKGVSVEVDPVSMTFANQPQWSVMGETWSLQCFDPTSGDTQLFNDDEYVVSFLITADGAAPGTYEIGFDRFHVVEQPNELVGPIVEFDATVVPGKLIIPDESSSEDPKPTDPKPTDPSEDPTDVPSKDAVYGDTNCDGKVNIADVVVLNKWLNDNTAYNLTAQGKINADCCDAKAGTPDENDSKAIIQSLVHLVKISDGSCKSTDLK